MSPLMTQDLIFWLICDRTHTTAGTVSGLGLTAGSKITGKGTHRAVYVFLCDVAVNKEVVHST